MTRRTLPFALLAALGGHSLAAQEPVHLVRCGKEDASACLRLETTLAPARAGALAAAEGAERWRLRSAGTRHGAHRAAILREARPPLRLLVLVDVSGSMSDGGLQTTRSALRAFLADLPDRSVRVAVVPFASARVEERIRAARFVPARSGGPAQVDALPAPDGNTALYSALRAGVDRLAAEPAPGDTAWNALLVITDGRNDVGRPGDDAALLAGSGGRASAVEAIRASGAHAWIVGLGAGLDEGELRALAAPRGAPFLVAEDPVALRRALEHIAGWIFTGRELLLPLGGSVQARLAPGPVVLAAEAMGGGERAEGVWIPPSFALPAFQGRSASPVEAAPGADSWRLRRIAVLAVWGGVLLLLWTAVPPLLRVSVPLPRGPAAPSPAAETGARRRVRLRTAEGAIPVASSSGAATDGLRAGLTEAPPRRPTDVTDKVRRPVRRP